MGRCYPRQVTYWLKALALTGLLAFGGTLHAAPPPIPAFEMAYRLKSAGLPFSVQAIRTLKPRQNGLWEMELHAKNLLGEIRETSYFQWDDCLPQTHFYGYRRNGLGRIKEAKVNVNWETGEATSKRTDKPVRQFPVETPSTDKLSLALALQCRLAEGETRITLSVADEREREEQVYAVIGREKLDLNGKPIETIKVQRLREPGSERQTYLWFAPEKNYTLIKLIQENSDGQHVLTLATDS